MRAFLKRYMRISPLNVVALLSVPWGPWQNKRTKRRELAKCLPFLPPLSDSWPAKALTCVYHVPPWSQCSSQVHWAKQQWNGPSEITSHKPTLSPSTGLCQVLVTVTKKEYIHSWTVILGSLLVVFWKVSFPAVVLFTFIYLYVSVCAHATAYMLEDSNLWKSTLFPKWGFWGLNSGHKAWWHNPYPWATSLSPRDRSLRNSVCVCVLYTFLSQFYQLYWFNDHIYVPNVKKKNPLV